MHPPHMIEVVVKNVNLCYNTVWLLVKVETKICQNRN
jgi:hypothetical protein